MRLNTKLTEKNTIDYTNLALNQVLTETRLIFELGSLYIYFLRVTHSRKPKGELYSLVHLLVLMMWAKLAAKDRPNGIADWVAHRVEQLHRVKVVPKARAPSHMTYQIVLQDTVQTEELEMPGII